jgi:uncharacterized protein YndB with AHSA1/START domain/uncharacterized protein YciI
MTLPALRRQIIVACDQATAYRLFVEEIGAWWPIASHGCFGEGASVALHGNQFLETGPEGEVAVWGTIIESDAPRALSFTWHPGREPDSASQVRVHFTETGDEHATLVTLEHSGWESYTDPKAARDEYSSGWKTVLGIYAEQLPTPTTATDLWFVLAHTAGPEAPPEGVFASPLFSRHIEFLGDLSARGVLVGAGPLPDTAGAGMTVVHAASMRQAREIVSGAQHDDGSVTSGLLEVQVRPWQVVVAPPQAS